MMDLALNWIHGLKSSPAVVCTVTVSTVKYRVKFTQSRSQLMFAKSKYMRTPHSSPRPLTTAATGRV
ncbi:uncharacterized [Tachysurus ichikawai]